MSLIVRTIVKKRDGGELTREEIEFFIRGLTDDSIPDYQVSAWAMAVLLNGMTPRETTDLALAMANSGEVLGSSDAATVRAMVEEHVARTGSDRAAAILADWANMLPRFVKVMPMDYQRVLQALERAKAAGLSGDEALAAAFEENSHDAARLGGS